VARRVQQVEDAAGILERHHRGDDGDAAVALNPHPVGPGAPALALGADIAGKLDRAARPQQVLGQRGLAGVGMGDDGEGAAAGDFGGGIGHAWAFVSWTGRRGALPPRPRKGGDATFDPI
jgi:hypothetical protein